MYTGVSERDTNGLANLFKWVNEINFLNVNSIHTRAICLKYKIKNKFTI